METITQTNRTILFAEINPERLNLLTLVGDVRGKSSLDDDKIKEINEELLDAPESINETPYDAWFVKVGEVKETEELLDADAYKAFVESEEA